MATTIDIDETLMAEAMKADGLRSKQAVAEGGLGQVVALHQQRQLLQLRSKIGFDADYDDEGTRDAR